MEPRICSTSWTILSTKYSILFRVYLLNRKKIAHIPLLQIYFNKIENRVTFKITSGYYIDHLPPETMKLLGSTK